MKYALALEYHGADFKGWQRQLDNQATIQAELENALSYVADESIHVVAAGRTDAGVHASHQIVHFETDVERTFHGWMFGCNSHLPATIAVKWVQAVADDFHARFSATSRRYRYFIYNRRARSALFHQHMTWHCQPLALRPMQKAATYLLGEHDFSAFRAAECQSKSTLRCVEEIHLSQHRDVICIEIKANAFLHHMVRNIVGTLFQVGEEKQAPEWVKSVLASRDRRQAGATAPPQGLYLVDVNYPEKFSLPTASEFTLGDLV